tara:strand:+ start:14915 stop:15157 length:243 start_codon:yes stop_codon:yes gene_type:complete
MKELLDNVKASLDDNTKGFSSRKLSALAIMICVIIVHGAWIKNCFIVEDFSLLSTVLTIDYTFVGGLLGLTTYSKLKDKK